MNARHFLVICLIVLLGLTSSAAPVQRLILRDKFSVGARQSRYWDFTASEGMEVKGRFRAEGGSGNDIQCMIIDEDAFENWRNGHAVTCYYNSGKVTVANIYARLPHGRFYLIFSNTFSVASNKVVEAEVRAVD